MIINRLINKGNNKRGRWASKQKEPTPEAAPPVPAEEGAEGGAEGDATENAEGEEATSDDDTPAATVAPAPTRGGWRGRGRRGRGARMPPPPVRRHIPTFRWLSSVKMIEVEPLSESSMHIESQTASAAIPAATSDGVAPRPPTRETAISYSIPPELVTLMDGITVAPVPKAREVPPCAVDGCKSPRKYRLVGAKDPEIGACSAPHLGSLQHLVVTR